MDQLYSLFVVVSLHRRISALSCWLLLEFCRGVIRPYRTWEESSGKMRQAVALPGGLMLVCICTAANTADSVGGEELVSKLNDEKLFPNLFKILGDNAYSGVGFEQVVRVTIEY